MSWGKCRLQCGMSEGEQIEASSKPLSMRGAPKFCRQCRYPWHGLESPGQCPECGKRYNLKDQSTYTYDAKPQAFGKRCLYGLLRLTPALLLLIGGFAMFRIIGRRPLYPVYGGWKMLALYPIWIVLTTYLFVDALWRVLGIPATTVITCLGGFATAAAISYLDMGLYAEQVNHWLAVIVGLLGILSGYFVVRADIHDLRS